MSDSILKQIAQETGVSVRTVYRILNGAVIQKSRPNVAKRATQIREIAARLNYRPNTAAKAISTGRFNCISLLVSESPKYGYMHHDLLRGIMHVLHKKRMQFAMSSISDRELSNNECMPSLLNHILADGMLINYSHNHPPHMEEMIRQNKIPVVWINTDMPENCVRPDDIQGGRLAVQSALAEGRKKIQFLHYNFSFYNNQNNPPNPAETHFSLGYRLHGYRQEMQDNGLEPMSFELTGKRLSDSLPIVAKWLNGLRSRPEVVITSKPSVALALHAAAIQIGLKLPEDLLIITFQGNLPHDELAGGIFTILIPWFETGKLAAEKIVQVIQGKERIFPTVEIPYSKPIKAQERDMIFPSLLDGDTDIAPN